MNKKQMARMVLKCPILFAYGPEVSYAPAVEWFREYLRMDTREVRHLRTPGQTVDFHSTIYCRSSKADLVPIFFYDLACGNGL